MRHDCIKVSYSSSPKEKRSTQRMTSIIRSISICLPTDYSCEMDAGGHIALRIEFFYLIFFLVIQPLSGLKHTTAKCIF